jgi:hypothetical protein
MLLMVSNTAWDDPNNKLVPEDLPPALWYSNIGCDGWEGTLDSTYTKILSHDDTASGYSHAPVLLSSDGLAEGTTSDGGRYFYGTRYTLSPDSTGTWTMHGEATGNPPVDISRVPDPSRDTVYFSILDFVIPGSANIGRYRLFGSTTDVANFTHTWIDWKGYPEGGCYPLSVFETPQTISADGRHANGSVSMSGICSTTYTWDLASPPP